jgi:hypothetical protein
MKGLNLASNIWGEYTLMTVTCDLGGGELINDRYFNSARAMLIKNV